MDISKNLKFYRKQNNFTQEYVANQLNISRQAISAWENNTTCPDIENLILLSHMYNISLNVLVGNNEKIENRSCTTASNIVTTSQVNDLNAEISKLESFFWILLELAAYQIPVIGGIIVIFALKNLTKESPYRKIIIIVSIVCVFHFLIFYAKILL